MYLLVVKKKHKKENRWRHHGYDVFDTKELLMKEVKRLSYDDDAYEDGNQYAIQYYKVDESSMISLKTKLVVEEVK